ncbi:MAG TPA: SHOCT domain-containing protein [Jatrophihabitans sp.]|nr:SHOCT domain-containing protein [Jatrophihabitans sp.]
MILASSGYPFLSVMWSIFIFMAWVLFIWLMITVYADLFRRNDIGGWVKAGWVIFTIFLPFLGVFVYLISQGRAMTARAQRNGYGALAYGDGYSDGYTPAKNGAANPADEIERAKDLLDSGAISQEEFTTLKQRALAG